MSENDLARPVVIGDIVDELNNRARSYVTMNFYDAQERALHDFANFMEPDVVKLMENDDKVFFERKS